MIYSDSGSGLQLHAHLGRGVVSSVRMVSLVQMVNLARMVSLARMVYMSGQKGSVFRSKCKQLHPLPWVHGQWQWCYGSNMSIIIIIMYNNTVLHISTAVY